MADFFEIDFLEVSRKKSGDAIGVRFELDGQKYIHVVDGGFSSTGGKLVEHIRKYYDNPNRIDRVVLTHPDVDHACGLQTVLEEFDVGELWMLRPWDYAADLLPHFPRFQSLEALQTRLKEAYGYVYELEKIADRKKIPIKRPFRGEAIGPFIVLAPSKERYLRMIIESDKTPDTSATWEKLRDLSDFLIEAAQEIVAKLSKSKWGDEKFSPQDTSCENEMSVVQHVTLCGKSILLTGDTGRAGLREAADFADLLNLGVRKLNYFQVPHHGGRRNVDTEILDRWLGKRIAEPLPEGSYNFLAVVSSASADIHHPRKSVLRAMHHRGAKVITTEDGVKCISSNAPDREGWVTAKATPYPEDQEEE